MFSPYTRLRETRSYFENRSITYRLDFRGVSQPSDVGGDEKYMSYHPSEPTDHRRFSFKNENARTCVPAEARFDLDGGGYLGGVLLRAMNVSGTSTAISRCGPFSSVVIMTIMSSVSPVTSSTARFFSSVPSSVPARTNPLPLLRRDL